MPTPHYGQPRYRAIADELRHRIETGAIPPGAFLSPESALRLEFRVSRGTIRQAIALLREADVATTEHGRGTYAKIRYYVQPGNAKIKQRQVAADSELAALFNVEIGAALTEYEYITQTGGTVDTVIRTYQLPARKPVSLPGHSNAHVVERR
ncbi:MULTISPECIES: GntR family transcriptional regulator [Micromonospora]|uniref:GntR family transcriptional regulator n=1 Tax=Micromonospora TaxID=1873 RepID=UPI0033CC1968